VSRVLARKWGGMFLGYLLGKNIGGAIALNSFLLTRDGCSSLLPFGDVLSFRSEIREVLGSDPPRFHHASRRRGAAWPLAARAQQSESMRRIVFLHASPS
jgi:hypothetical protein